MACPVPTAISNGYYVGAKISYAAGDVIQYVCNTGYVMSGSPVTVCDVSGMWVPASGSLPECNNSYLSNSKSMTPVMQFVCNALYLHTPSPPQGTTKKKIHSWFFLSFSLVFTGDIVDGVRRVGHRFDSYRHML